MRVARANRLETCFELPESKEKRTGKLEGNCDLLEHMCSKVLGKHGLSKELLNRVEKEARRKQEV